MDSKYSCVRCGYETENKYSMNTHLYKKKKPCPTAVNNIELTDEIKKYILENRIYKIPEITPEVKPEVKPEVTPEVKPVKVKEVKPEVKTEVNRTIEINYDELYMKLMMLLKLVIKCLKDAVFDPYEMYLIHFMDSENFDQKLRDYYKFIATFGFNPIVKNKSDNFIQYYRFYRDKEHLDLAEKTFNLSEKYMKLYTSEKTKLIKTEKELLTKKMMELVFIKKDTESYEQIGKLFNMDEEFIKINA